MFLSQIKRAVLVLALQWSLDRGLCISDDEEEPQEGE